MTGLWHKMFKALDCDIFEGEEKRVDVVFLDQIQVLDLDIFLLYELPDDLDKLLTAMLLLLESLLYFDVLCTLFDQLYLVWFFLSHGLHQ